MTTIDNCRSELRAIIAELEAIESEIRNSYRGIGQDACANTVAAIARHYRSSVLGRIAGLNQSRLMRIFRGEE